MRKKNWRKKIFNWHMWTGVVFFIPVFVVAVTAILIAHEDRLGTKQMLIKAGWLPGYQAGKENIIHFLDDVKACHADADVSYFGTQLGLVKEAGGKLVIVEGTEGIEVRDILARNHTLWIATKNGIYQYEATKPNAIRVLKGDFHGLFIKSDTLVALAGKHGYTQSIDNGVSWSVFQKLSVRYNTHSIEQLASHLDKTGVSGQLSWQKLILDLHTGEAFLGKGRMWIWIDLVALSLFLITFTGIWMWFKRKIKKSKLQASGNRLPENKRT